MQQTYYVGKLLIILFIATDTDRILNKDLPLSVPIAYGMKGKVH